MTARDKKLLMVVVPVILVILGYSFFFGIFAPSPAADNGSAGNAAIDFNSASRLLSLEDNIKNRNRIITGRLDKLKAMFYLRTKPEEAQIALLKEAEAIAAVCNLNVQQKNMMRYSETLIGVTMSGKTTPDALFRFMQQTSQSRMGLKINRIQVHVLPDQRQIDYQIAVCSLLL